MTAPLQFEDLHAKIDTLWLGRDLLCVAEVDSTNTLAAQRAADGAQHGLVVVADSQTAGRGRMQRSWQSPPGLNLYFSALLDPITDWPNSPPLSLAMGVAIAEAIEPLVPVRPELKWPNDVLIGGRKVAGILIEAAAQSGRVKHVICGIGVNVNQTEFAAEIASRATSLALAAGAPLDRAEVLAKLLGSMESYYGALNRGDGARVLERWRSFAPWLGSEVRVTQRESTISGTAVALDANGALRLRDAAGREHLIHCGDAAGAPGWTYT